MRDLETAGIREIEIAGAVSVVGAGGDAWVTTRSAVHCFAADGAPLHAIEITQCEIDPLAIGPCAPPRLARGTQPITLDDVPTLTPCRIGAGAVIVHGARPLRIDGAITRSLKRTNEQMVPLTEGVVTRVGRGFAICTERDTQMLAIPVDLAANTRLCSGALLRGGKTVGLELRSRTGHYLLAVDLETHQVTSRLRLADARGVVWVEERSHVVVVRATELLVLDLEHGRCVVTRRIEPSVVEIACDELGTHLVLDHGDRITTIDYADLVGARASVRSRVADVGPEPEPEPVDPAVDPQPEQAPRTDARELREARSVAAVEPLLPDTLPGLGLSPLPPPVERAHLARFAADAFGLVAAMCRRAVAEAWDSGRLGSGGVLPFASEVAAALDGAHGGAPEALAVACDRERAAELRFAHHDLPEMPLGNIAAEHALSDLAARIALIVAAPRMWPELARIYTIISNDPSRPLVDELLVAQLIGVSRGDRRRIAVELAEGSPLLVHGIVVRGPGERAFASLSVPATIALRLAGDRFEAAAGARAASVQLGAILAPRGAVAALCAELAAPRAEHARIVVRGRGGSGRRTLVAALAATAGRSAGLVELMPGDAADERLRIDLRDAALRGYLPCVSGLDALGDDPAIRARLQRVLDDHPGPLAVRCDPGARAPLSPGHCTIDLDPLDEEDRARAWRDGLEQHGLPPEPASALATRWAVGPGTALRAVSMVARETPSDLTAALDGAVRRLRADRLAGLADKVDRLADWSDLVLPEEMVDSLRELIARVRHRNIVLRNWGMERVTSTARALTALFQGGPGTGKTLAAGVLARELGYDLYRVDISRVMSRWLGETEKNLARIFDGASDGETILLFDEADTLFGRRTEVKSSHDRYANVETNYLLQRLDSWNGIAILTTNFGTSIDPAFRRRLTLQLQFPFPDDNERTQLWRAHLPASVPVDGDLDLPAIARRFKLSGGYIRNAALRACYLAVGERSPLTAEHLVRAIKLEFRDMAKVAESGRVE